MIRVVDLGRVDYKEALDIQKKVQQQRRFNLCDDTLLLLEHPPVITKGIRSDDQHILKSDEFFRENDVEVHESSRGGDVTYLGPGQIVGYTIMSLDSTGRDIRRFVGHMEQAVMNILHNEFGIEAHTEDKKYTGVFVETNKIAALGIAVNHRVTMHGFAFNINTNLEHFKWIVPCGLKDRWVTSVEALTGEKQSLSKFKSLIQKEYEHLFDIPSYNESKEDFMSSIGDEVYETRMAEGKKLCS